MVIQHLKQIGKVKSLYERVPPELTKHKNGILSSHRLLFYATTNHFSVELWRGMKSGFNTTTGCDQLNDWTAKLQSSKAPKTSQSQTCTQKVVVSIWWSAAVWPTTAFWILVKPLYLRSMLSTSMRFTENCKACSYIGQQNGPKFRLRQCLTTCHTTNTSKVEWIGLQSLAHLPYSPGLSPNDSHFFKHLDNFLLGKMLPQPTGCRKSFPRVHQIPQHGFLCYRSKQTYFLLVKMCWL